MSRISISFLFFLLIDNHLYRQPYSREVTLQLGNSSKDSSLNWKTLQDDTWKPLQFKDQLQVKIIRVSQLNLSALYIISYGT